MNEPLFSMRWDARDIVDVVARRGAGTQGLDVLDVSRIVDAVQLPRVDTLRVDRREPLRQARGIERPRDRAEPVGSLGVAGAGVVLEEIGMMDPADGHGV